MAEIAELEAFLRSVSGRQLRIVSHSDVVKILAQIRKDFESSGRGAVFSTGVRLLSAMTNLIFEPRKGVLFRAKFNALINLLKAPHKNANILGASYGIPEKWLTAVAKDRDAYRLAFERTSSAVLAHIDKIEALEKPYLEQFRRGLQRMNAKKSAEEILAELSGTIFFDVRGDFLQGLVIRRYQKMMAESGLGIFRFNIYPALERDYKDFQKKLKLLDHAPQIGAPVWYEATYGVTPQLKKGGKEGGIMIYEVQRNKEILQLAKTYGKGISAGGVNYLILNVDRIAAIFYKVYELLHQKPEYKSLILGNKERTNFFDPDYLKVFLLKLKRGIRDKETAIQVERFIDFISNVEWLVSSHERFKFDEQWLVEELLDLAWLVRKAIRRKALMQDYSLALFLPFIVGFENFPFDVVITPTSGEVKAINPVVKISERAREMDEYDTFALYNPLCAQIPIILFHNGLGSRIHSLYVSTVSKQLRSYFRKGLIYGYVNFAYLWKTSGRGDWETSGEESIKPYKDLLPDNRMVSEFLERAIRLNKPIFESADMPFLKKTIRTFLNDVVILVQHLVEHRGGMVYALFFREKIRDIKQGISFLNSVCRRKEKLGAEAKDFSFENSMFLYIIYIDILFWLRSTSTALDKPDFLKYKPFYKKVKSTIERVTALLQFDDLEKELYAAVDKEKEIVEDESVHKIHKKVIDLYFEFLYPKVICLVGSKHSFYHV